MTWEHLLAFNLALFVALASPGPALLVSIQTTLTTGRRAGVAAGLGLATMAATWTLMALLGLEVVFQIFPWAYAIVKAFGALYLIYIAWGMWQGARDKINTAITPASRSFRQGFLVNLTNPKSMLFAAAVLVVIFPSNMSWVENSLVIANHFIIEVVAYSAIAFLMSTQAVKIKYLSAKLYLDRIAAVVLGALGIRLLVGK